MNRFLLRALVVLLVLSCLAFGPTAPSPGRAAPAYAGQALALESLPFTHATAVSVLTPSKPGGFQGFSIDHGLQFTSHNNRAVDSALEFHLGGRYAADRHAVYRRRILIRCATHDAGHQRSGNRGQADLSRRGDQPNDYQPRCARRAGHLHRRGTERLLRRLGVADLVANLGGHGFPSITITSPAANATLPSATPVSIAWQRFAGAAGYVLNVAMVRQSAKQVLTAGTKVSLTQLVLGGTSYSWNPTGFLPGTYRCAVVPVDKYGDILPGASAELQFFLSS